MTTQKDELDRISNAVYEACVAIFEELEFQKKIHGNGHHHAQKIAAEAEAMLKRHWIDKSLD